MAFPRYFGVIFSFIFAQGQHERHTSDPASNPGNGPLSPPYCGPFVQPGHQGFEAWPVQFPPRMPNLSTQLGRDFQAFQPVREAAFISTKCCLLGGLFLTYFWLRFFQHQGFPWQPPCPQQRGTRGPGEAARPPPENAGKLLLVFVTRWKTFAADISVSGLK